MLFNISFKHIGNLLIETSIICECHFFKLGMQFLGDNQGKCGVFLFRKEL